MLAEVPGQGGWAWVVLQYLLGLRQLGHEVYFVDALPDTRNDLSDTSFEASSIANYFHQTLSEFGLQNASSLLATDIRKAVGLHYDELVQIADKCDVLLNVSGRLRDVNLLDRIPLRVYLDLDPAFTQLWQAAHGIDMHLAGHTHFVTVGLAIGHPVCEIPTCGVQWTTSHQPVVLSQWPRASKILHGGLTTVANWRGYGSAEYRGEFYGQKAHSLREFFELPRHTTESFILALAIHPDEVQDLRALRENGWQLLDPVDVVGTPAQYRRFVQGSKGEFGIAKSGYVKARCGWFSDRSICYLASGRPVIAQDTGFSSFLPTGKGLLSFETMDDVLCAIEDLNANYWAHAAAARKIAEDHFDSQQVLTRMLHKIGAV